MPSPAELVAALSRAYALTDVFPGGDPVSLDSLGHLQGLLLEGASVEVGPNGLRVDGIEVPDFHGRSGRFARDLRTLGVERVRFDGAVSMLELERFVRTLRDDVVHGWGDGLRAMRVESGARIGLEFDDDDDAPELSPTPLVDSGEEAHPVASGVPEWPAAAGPTMIRSIEGLFDDPWEATDSGLDGGAASPPSPLLSPSEAPSPDDVGGPPPEEDEGAWVDLEAAFAAGLPDALAWDEEPERSDGVDGETFLSEDDLLFPESDGLHHPMSFLDELEEDAEDSALDPGLEALESYSPRPPLPEPPESREGEWERAPEWGEGASGWEGALDPEDTPDTEGAPEGWGDPAGAEEDLPTEPEPRGDLPPRETSLEPEQIDGFVLGSALEPSPDPALLDGASPAEALEDSGHSEGFAAAGSADEESAAQESAEDLSAEPVDRLVDRFLAPGGGDRGALVSELESRASATLRPGVLDSLADAVMRLVEAAERGVPGAGELSARLATPGVTSRLAARLGHERDVGGREVLLRVTARLGEPMAAALGDALSDDPERSARRAYLDALVALGPVGRKAVDDMVADSRWFVVRNGVAILGEVGGADALARLARTLDHGDPRVRREAVMALARIGGDDAGRQVERMLSDSEGEVRAAAAVAAGALRLGRSIRTLHRLLEEEKDPGVVEAVAGALGALGDAGSVPLLEKKAAPSFFSRTPSSVRVAAYRALHVIGTPRARVLVEAARTDRDPQVREAIQGLQG